MQKNHYTLGCQKLINSLLLSMTSRPHLSSSSFSPFFSSTTSLSCSLLGLPLDPSLCCSPPILPTCDTSPRRPARRPPAWLEQRATPPRHMWGPQPPPWPRGRGPLRELRCRRTWPRIPPRRQLLPWPAEATTTSFHDSPKFELLVHMRLKLIRSLASLWPITPFSSSNLS